jgi:tetraacyldisaccharide 4'-kinase
VRFLLYPLIIFYGPIVYLRNLLYNLKILRSKKFAIPIISIGNITAGGTGKTPHTEFLVKILKKRFKIAILSRGYKRKTKGFRLAHANSSVAEVGDEPLQIKRKFPDLVVAVHENRAYGVEQLLQLEKAGKPELILLDDAFQHRRIKPALNILLIDFYRQLKDDLLLPAGMLREGKGQMRRADVVIFTKCPDTLTSDQENAIIKGILPKPHQSIYFTGLQYGIFTPVFHAPESPNIDASSSIIMLSGIAHPNVFKRYLCQITAHICEMSFPDHHFYKQKDLQKVEENYHQLSSANKFIVTTEKDMIRLRDCSFVPDVLRGSMYYLPLEIYFLNGKKDAFTQRVIHYIDNFPTGDF